MSFSQNTKTEILENLDFKQNLKPFVLSLILGSREVDSKSFVSFISDNLNVYNILLKIFKKHTDENVENLILFKEEYKIGAKCYYKIKITSSLLYKFLSLNDGEDLLSCTSSVVSTVDDIKMFCKGAYIGTATSSIKISSSPENKTTSGYHLEFDSKNYDFLLILSDYLAQFNILPKIIKRKNFYVLYIKDAEQVSDTLALVGAYNAVVTLQNEIVKREFRNKINRQTNCESGNISKLVSASMKQINAIEKINSTIGLSSLAPDLEEVAILRLANPEESLTDLLKLSTLNLTKSGLNHRLRKIISIAEHLT